MMSHPLLLARKYTAEYTGMLAHIVQRVSGLLLLFYLFLHVRTIHELSKGPQAFDAALATFRSPFFKLLEIGLLGTVIVHAFNGVRITLLDMGYAPANRKRFFWVYTAALGLAVFFAGAIPLFLYSVLRWP
jgi:succinate dehydrogenase / fumarate reductase, cytochrome b subunit